MSDAFERLMMSTNAPLAVVTTAAEGERSGCLIGFHGQAGVDPERYSLRLSKANHTYRVALRAEHLAVHFPHADVARHVEVARHFGTRTGAEVDKLEGLDWSLGEGGVPLLADLPDRVLVRRLGMLDVGGDHVHVVTQVVEASCAARFTPLRLTDAADWEPGHRTEERAIDPAGD